MNKFKLGLFAAVVLAFLGLAATTQVDYNNQIKNIPHTQPQGFNFTPQTPGGSLASGNNTITMSPVPKGVNGTDTNHPLYVSGGTGTAEACTINGGSGTSGQSSGSIIINCSNTHSGAWTIQSATAGAREALIFGGAGMTLFFPPATYTFQASLTVDSASVHLTGARNSILQAAANANLVQLIRTTNAATGFILDNLTLDGNRANNGTAQNPGAAGNTRNIYGVVSIGSAHSTIDKCEIRFGQVNGVYLGDTSIAASDFKLTNNYIHDNGGTINSSGFGTGIYLNGGSGTTISGVHIIGNHFENIYNTVTGPGQSGAINGAATNDTVVTGNYIKNNFNVIGGQISTGSTPASTCASNDTNWTVSGNTVIQTTHFGGDITEGVEVCGQFQTVAGNTFLGNGVGGVVLDAGATDTTVSGNYISANGNVTAGTTYGIQVSGSASGATSRVVISGNYTTGYTYGLGINFASDDFINAVGNQFIGTTAAVSDSSTSSHVSIVIGLNFNTTVFPVSPTGSPMTLNIGHEPGTLAITGGTVSHVSIGGTDFCTSSPCFLHVSPNTTVVVTYSSAPTINVTSEP